MAVTKRLRYEVLRRDGHACRYCGATAPDAKLTVDHVIPQALGGSDDPTNLVTACEPCNSGKTSMPADAPIVADVQDDALRWAAAMEKAAEMAHSKYEGRLDYRNTFREAWDDWKVGPESAQKIVQLDSNWETSLDNFYEAGLPDWELKEAVRAAMTNQKVTPANTFRYFAGICWTKIRQMQEQARHLIDASPVPTGCVVISKVVDEIAERWLSAYQARCKDKGIDCSNVTSDSAAEIATALLEQGFSADRVAEAAEQAGHRLTVNMAEHLHGSLGDFTMDATMTWTTAWIDADVEGPRWRSSVPPVKAWADFKIELQGAISAGLLDEDILTACNAAGTRHEALLLGLPDWEGRWEGLGLG
ncbi:HNH endonuclease [Streptomyces bluensis]|uniref:HNH endonuclease n=1 Tax=Streptomyces bluensis TaxID=33897 RepID=UPI003321AE9C